MFGKAAGSRRGAWTRIAVICLAGSGPLGCEAAVQKTARSAAPAAVEGAVEETTKPGTRDDIARILADPEIRAAASSLSAAVVAGALDGVTDEQRADELRRMTDTIVSHVGASVARSLRDEIGPQLSKMFADAVDRSIGQALDAQTEQRLEAMTSAAARGMAKGVSEALVDDNGQPSTAWGLMLGQLTRDATRGAALGIDDAVRHAQQRERSAPPTPVLAALGTLSGLAQLLPFLLAAGAAVFLVLCAAPVAWLVARLRRRERESLAHQEAAIALARAIRTAEPREWSSDLREHLTRETTRGTVGADDLRRLLREHAARRASPRDGAPRSERATQY